MTRNQHPKNIQRRTERSMGSRISQTFVPRRLGMIHFFIIPVWLNQVISSWVVQVKSFAGMTERKA